MVNQVGYIHDIEVDDIIIYSYGRFYIYFGLLFI